MSKLEPAGESSTTSPGEALRWARFDRRLQVFGHLDGRGPLQGVTHHIPALADGEYALHLARHQVPQLPQIPALEAPAQDQQDSAVEALERGSHGLHVGGLGVVVEPHSVHLRHFLERVGKTLEVRERVLDLFPRHSEKGRGGRSGHRVQAVVPSHELKLFEGGQGLGRAVLVLHDPGLVQVKVRGEPRAESRHSPGRSTTSSISLFQPWTPSIDFRRRPGPRLLPAGFRRCGPWRRRTPESRDASPGDRE